MDSTNLNHSITGCIQSGRFEVESNQRFHHGMGIIASRPINRAILLTNYPPVRDTTLPESGKPLMQFGVYPLNDSALREESR
jgi:hypothetical protein